MVENRKNVSSFSDCITFFRVFYDFPHYKTDFLYKSSFYRFKHFPTVK